MHRIALLLVIIAFFSFSCNRENAVDPKSTSRSINEEAKKASQMVDPSQIEAEMVLIGAGSFLMGSNDLTSAEKPVHRVNLDAYYIGKFEVTNAQFRAFCDATGYPYPGAEWSPDGETSLSELKEKPDYPVVG